MKTSRCEAFVLYIRTFLTHKRGILPQVLPIARESMSMILLSQEVTVFSQERLNV